MKRKCENIISIIVSVIVAITTYLFYYLHFNSYSVFEVDKWIWRHINTEVSVFDIILSRKTELIIFTALYMTIFHLINKTNFSQKVKYVIAFIMSIMYALQIYITDTIISYQSFDYTYKDFINLSFSEFSISDIWSREISRYGYWVLIIYLFIMLSALSSMFSAKSYLKQDAMNKL